MANKRKKYGEGSYHKMKTDVYEIGFQDFQNPWTFHHLFTRDDATLYEWLRNNGLLAETVKCTGGGGGYKGERKLRINLLSGVKKIMSIP